ncbi:hypothetical protein HDN1F_10050 [gamma proteobacterium HdN1]|nr:hypothetical protein HDN1F_10050 [gamma proteobacterium HdN1]
MEFFGQGVCRMYWFSSGLWLSLDRFVRNSLPYGAYALITASILFFTNVASADPNHSKIWVDRLIIKLKDEPNATGRTHESASAQENGQSPKTQNGRNWRVRLSQIQARTQIPFQPLRTLRNGAVVLQLAQRKSLLAVQVELSTLQQQDEVAYVEPDLRMVAKYIPNDPLYNQQWHYFEPDAGIRLPDAWNSSKGAGIVVAVLDTGVRPHSDIAGNLLPGYDFITDPAVANDNDGRDANANDPGDWLAASECGNDDPPQAIPSSWHGTHVAGTIAARADNHEGGVGVAPLAKVLPVRVLGKCGGYLSDIADAIVWAAGVPVDGVPTNPHPARIINMSLGSAVPADCGRTYQDAIRLAREAGALVVVAAGNENGNVNRYPPASCPGVFTVGAVGRNGARAYYSNYGAAVNVMAPGGNQSYANDPNGILSTWNAGTQAAAADTYGIMQGTSMATPHVAGAAALVWAAKPNASADEVAMALSESARPVTGYCVGCGTGIVDAAQAIELIKSGYVPPQRADISLNLIGDTGKFVEDPEDKTVGTVRYKASIMNNGPDDAKGVVLVNQFPEGFAPISIVADQGGCDDTGLACSLGTLAVGSKTFITFEVSTKIRSKADFSATASSEQNDPKIGNNTVTKKFGGAMGAIGVTMLLVLVRRRFVSVA